MKLTYSDFRTDRAETEASRFTQGNGMIGIRGIQDEDYTFETPGIYHAGLYASSLDESPNELVCLPNILTNNLWIDDERFSLESGSIIEYKRELNEENGLLVRSVVWKSPSERTISIKTERFVDQLSESIHQRITIIPINCPIKIKLETGIDGSITNSGRQHLLINNCKQIDSKTIAAEYFLNDSLRKVAMSVHYTMDGVASISERKFNMTFNSSVDINSKFILEKKAVIAAEPFTLQPYENVIFFSRDENNFSESLMNSEKQFWNRFWRKNRIQISSKDNEDQELIDFAEYHLAIMAPRSDDRISIGAKGLSGEGYKGHAFWDNELFVLPFYMSTNVNIARNLLEYRFNHLSEAKERARESDYKGAWYPWESAFTGHDETPKLSSIDVSTGEAQPVTSNIHEIHINSDIAYAMEQFELISKFWPRTAILEEMTKFWISRSSLDDDGFYHYNHVTGPDEYTENVSDNAYTNYMIYLSIKSVLPKLNGKLREQAKRLINNIMLPSPNEFGIIPQDSTFLGKPELPVDEFRRVTGQQSILKKYSRKRVINSQVLKQADLIMLFFLYPKLFEKRVQEKNFDFYEHRTVHDSSLSKPIYGIVASRIGNIKEGYKFFQSTKEIDFNGDLHSSDSGIHAAAMGSIWMMIIKGFVDIRQVDMNSIELNPQIPDEWDNLNFRYQFGESSVSLKINHKECVLKNISNSPIHVSYAVTGRVYVIKPDEYITIQLHNKKGR
ncbi:glycosyl hydrolase family 65 protein [Companilactobacillus zhachilii]|uniref:glycosyl hydrolase family 65 protein n=1 Tax=Companilactobacillus zhachilii TaxID=2304606 RepID=UPI0040342010